MIFFLLLVLKCLKFNCFNVTEPKNEVLSVIEVPHSDPLLRLVQQNFVMQNFVVQSASKNVSFDV